jgi:adenylate cyclase
MLNTLDRPNHPKIRGVQSFSRTRSYAKVRVEVETRGGFWRGIDNRDRSGSDRKGDYLADALTDQLTTALARIRDSFVIARNTAFTFKGKPVDAKAIGKDLGVRYVLEGSVLPSPNQVRINAQLIDADSGAHLWADQFDTPGADLLQMQDEIVTHLARAMDLQLPEVEAARFKRSQAANPDAEDLALQCVAAIQKARYTGKDADAGSRLCEQALDADPNNVRALAWLAVKLIFNSGGRLSPCKPLILLVWAESFAKM